MGVVVDILEGTYLREENGNIVEVNRLANISGLTPGLDMKAILNTVGLPSPGSLYVGSDPTVVLVNRNLSLNGQQDGATVELIYKRKDGAGSQAAPLKYKVRGESSVQQITTNKDPDSGEVLTVDYDDGTDTHTAQAEMSVMVPQQTFTITTVISNANPIAVQRQWVGMLNSTTWHGDDAKTWLCMSAPYELMEGYSTTPQWQFTFTWQYIGDAGDTWQPIIWFKDETGAIPVDVVVDSNGARTVIFYGTADFNSLYPGT